MPDHAVLSPSGSHRWMACPGSIRKSKDYPERESSEYAIDGTHTHTLLEHCLKNDGDPMKMVGVKLSDHEGEFTVDSDRARRVESALTYIEQRSAELSATLVKSEEKVYPGRIISRDDIYGTADVQIVSDETLEIIDYKDGRNLVAPDSPQLKLYGAGAVMQHYDKGTFFKTVRLTVIQPKIGPPRAVDIAPAELHKWMTTEVEPAARATDDPDAPLVAGRHCKWCPAAGNCPKQAEEALKGAQIMFQNVDLARQSADQEPSELSDEKIREVLEAEPMINEFLKSVREEARKRFESGRPIPGLKMVYSGRGNRDWNMSEEEVTSALSKLGIPKKYHYQKKLLTPPQVEKLTWESKAKGETVTKQLTDRKIQKLNDEFVTKGKGNKMIVPESDSREAIHTDAASMFAEVQTEQQADAQIPAWLQ